MLATWRSKQVIDPIHGELRWNICYSENAGSNHSSRWNAMPESVRHNSGILWYRPIVMFFRIRRFSLSTVRCVLPKKASYYLKIRTTICHVDCTIRGQNRPKDTLVVAKAKLGLEPRFRKRFGALTLDGNRMQTRSRASSPTIAIGLAG